MIDRRAIIAAASALLASPFALAQKPARHRVVGFLSPFPYVAERWSKGVITMRLRELGWVEGTNLVVEQARADGQEDRLPDLAEDLVRKRVDVIFAFAPEAAVAAARATRTIPIVFWRVALPVEQRLVQSLARPGGNVTGVTYNAAGEVQVVKPLETLRQIAPSATRLASIYTASTAHTVSGGVFTYPELTSAIAGLGYDSHVISGQRDEDVDSMFMAMLEARVHAIFIPATPFTTRVHTRIVEFANRHRLPSASDSAQFVEGGVLVGYGPDIPETMRRAVDYVDRILRGARPADMPVEMPSKFVLAVNLKTAKAIGVSVPRSTLLRADKVIE